MVRGSHPRLIWRRPIPPPPARLRRGPFAPGAFPSRLRSERLTSWLGVWLGLAFGICLVTGLISHELQHPASWFVWPTRPVWLYRVTQGLHVATGLAAVPLLLVKLWSVFPALFRWPPVRDPAHALSRAGLLVLVASAVFELASGVLNTARWYVPFGFGFPSAHYWTAWLAGGALLVHIGAQLPVVRRALRSPASEPEPEPGPAPAQTPVLAQTPVPGSPGEGGGLTRRGLLASVGATVGILTLATAGQTIAPLSRISLLAPRRPHLGPQGLPVNRSATAAGVGRTALEPGYRLVVTGTRRLELALPELRARPQHHVELPIACVEGWSASAHWTGVRLADLLDDAGADADAEIVVESLERAGTYRSSVLPAAFARDPLTLLALRLNGEPLALDHGYPCRLIAPNRPGVLQTKWVGAITARAR
ncbi:molybdopterin-dependent oxidoreductase [Cryptosporangium sp. NPDC051539]|uniref:molybdopterin-dependent oxidoreductase n=1 Tax=Cryptosporangium sp. NPDC051539 TaxID=3363962 RepID=UPI003789B5DE